MWKMRYVARRYDAPACYALIAIMIVVFIVDFFSEYRLSLFLSWSPSVEWLKTGPYWQPFTFPFVHPNQMLQALFDCVLLYFIGTSLERAWGSGKFLFFFFSSGILPGLILLPQTATSASQPFFEGMAGSFVAIGVAFAAMNPGAQIMFFFIPMSAWIWAGIIVALDLFGWTTRYGGPLQALLAVVVVVVYAYFFATRRVSLPNLGGGSRGAGGPSMKERFDRWQQRRKMRQWQRRVSKIDRPEDLFKDK
jgi:membrane associated rhomboid family serine protease